MVNGDVDAELRRLAGDTGFPHRDAARHALRFRTHGDVADLVAVLDDPHPCGMTDVLFALAGAERLWLNWVPMPSEALTNLADELAVRRARGERLDLGRVGLSAAEPASATTAARRVTGPLQIDIEVFPHPDIRATLRPGRYAVWRYEDTEPVPTLPEPTRAAVETLREVAEEPWASPVSGYLQAGQLGKLPLDDLLGLLCHPPAAPDTPRWRHLAESTPTYWFRLLQPWVCLGILHHADHEPWPVSTRRQVLIDLAFGIEDWVADAALFALVTAAYREPGLRAEVRGLVRARLDAAMAAPRLVTIEESLANLMLVTPGRTPDDAAAARAALTPAEPPPPPRKRRWWRRS